MNSDSDQENELFRVSSKGSVASHSCGGNLGDLATMENLESWKRDLEKGFAKKISLFNNKLVLQRTQIDSLKCQLEQERTKKVEAKRKTEESLEVLKKVVSEIVQTNQNLEERLSALEARSEDYGLAEKVIKDKNQSESVNRLSQEVQQWREKQAGLQEKIQSVEETLENVTSLVVSLVPTGQNDTPPPNTPIMEQLRTNPLDHLKFPPPSIQIPDDDDSNFEFSFLPSPSLLEPPTTSSPLPPPPSWPLSPVNAPAPASPPPTFTPTEFRATSPATTFPVPTSSKSSITSPPPVTPGTSTVTSPPPAITKTTTTVMENQGATAGNRQETRRKRHEVDTIDITELSCVCGTKFKNKCTLTQHILKRTVGPQFGCESCNKKFFDFRNLKIHMEKMHNTLFGEDDRVGCCRCGSIFPTRGLLRLHQKSCKVEEEVSYSQILGSILNSVPESTPSILITNVVGNANVENQTRPAENVIPEGVGGTGVQDTYDFTIESSSSDILQFGVKKFLCQICNKLFREKKNLQKHTLIMHKLQPVPEEELAAGTNGYGNKSVNNPTREDPTPGTSTSGNEPRVSVTGTRGDPIPGTSTSGNSSRVQEKRHGKDYARILYCLCGKSFENNHKLKKHLQYYANQKRCTCKLCGMSFPYPYLLKLHNNRKHNSSYVNSQNGGAFSWRGHSSSTVQTSQLPTGRQNRGKPFRARYTQPKLEFSNPSRPIPVISLSQIKTEPNLTTHGMGSEKCGENGTIIFACKCGKTFDSRRGISRHVKKMETATRSFKCNGCSLRFPNQLKLTAHQREKHQGIVGAQQ